MLRKNFPGNKKLRQMTSLEGLEQRLKDPEYIPERFKETKPTKAELDKVWINMKYEAKILKERIARVQ